MFAILCITWMLLPVRCYFLLSTALHLGSFVLPYESSFFCFCEEFHWDFGRAYTESVGHFKWQSLLKILILPIHEHGKPAHLLVSSSVLLLSVLSFPLYDSFPCLLRFVTGTFYVRLFTYFEAVGNGSFTWFLSWYVQC